MIGMLEIKESHHKLGVNDIMRLRTAKNKKTGGLSFRPVFSDFFNTDDLVPGQDTIRIFRPVNNDFKIEKADESWLAEVAGIKIDREKKTMDNRVYVYVYVYVAGREERLAQEYSPERNLYVERLTSGQAEIRCEEFRDPKVVIAKYREGDSFVEFREIFVNGELRMRQRIRVVETVADYSLRRLKEIEKSPFKQLACVQGGAPEEVILREFLAVPKIADAPIVLVR